MTKKLITSEKDEQENEETEINGYLHSFIVPSLFEFYPTKDSVMQLLSRIEHIILSVQGHIETQKMLDNATIQLVNNLLHQKSVSQHAYIIVRVILKICCRYRYPDQSSAFVISRLHQIYEQAHLYVNLTYKDDDFESKRRAYIKPEYIHSYSRVFRDDQLVDAVCLGLSPMVNQLASQFDDLGVTSSTLLYGPLHAAADFDHCNLIEYLIERGVDINEQCRGKGRTALHYASGYHCSHNVHVNLHIVLEQAHVEVCRLLLRLGASKTIRDNFGMLPVDLCRYDESNMRL